MVNAFIWGLLATSSLIMGGIIAIRFTLSNRIIGIIMGFGAGTLISAISYELIFEAVKLAKGSGFPAAGLFVGAATFFLSDKLIGNFGADNRLKVGASKSSSLVIPMVLAIILDGVPESIVIGLGIFEGGKVSLAMLVAVFISNLPEAIAGSSGMKKADGAEKTYCCFGSSFLCFVHWQQLPVSLFSVELLRNGFHLSRHLPEEPS